MIEAINLVPFFIKNLMLRTERSPTGLTTLLATHAADSAAYHTSTPERVIGGVPAFVKPDRLDRINGAFRRKGGLLSIERLR